MVGIFVFFNLAFVAKTNSEGMNNIFEFSKEIQISKNVICYIWV